jgi:hypothetical protein
MDKHVWVKNYFANVTEMDFVLHVYQEDDEAYVQQPKRYFLPMQYSEEYNIWFINLEDHQLWNYRLMYKLRINKTFMVNHFNGEFRIMNQSMISVHNPQNPIVAYETGIEVKTLYTFAAFANKIHRKASFLPSESLVQLWVQASNRTNILVQVEWLDPGNNVYSITEHVAEPEQGFQSFVSLQQDYGFLYGQWTVNVYTGGQRIAGTQFYVTYHEKYKGYPSPPTINHLL